MALYTRPALGEIGTPRLQALSSAKNRQNAITPDFTSPLKPASLKPSTGKRSRGPAVFEDEDSENVDPSIFNSPSKKSKTSGADGFTFSKPAQFSLFTSPSKPIPASIATSPSIPSVRKALSSPNTSASTPNISNSRGSPKHKRIGLLSKRRVSSSPFRRVDPPSFHSSPALPFSIDAALKGSIPDYTPKSAISTPTVINNASTLDESMPKGWFFEIHEDTLEQEAANLMEHSASVLDISSDDDMETKRRNEELERGKENIPPPDSVLNQPHARAQSSDPNAMQTGDEVEAVEHVKLPRLRKIAQDAMDEDRLALGELPAAEFYGEGCDATSYVTVDAGIEKPSSLSKEFDFSVPTPEKKAAKEEEVAPVIGEESITIFSDETATVDDVVAEKEEVVAAVTEVVSEAQEIASVAVS